MELSFIGENMAQWLNTTFYNFDRTVFIAMNAFAERCGDFFTPFFKIITLFGEGGIFFVALGVVLLLFSKTRKIGVYLGFSILFSAIITNIILKNVVARPRPFLASEEYKDFWIAVGSVKVKDLSFPSGHASVTMACMTALFIFFNKKWSWTFFIFAFVMGLTRSYLAVHYATDVIAGLIAGGVAGVLGVFASKLTYFILNKYPNKFTKFCLEFDVVKLFTKKEEPKE